VGLAEEAEGVAVSVTREAARRIAEAYLAEPPGTGARVGTIRRWSEILGGLPGLYWTRPNTPPSPERLARAWVAYLEEPGPTLMLRSSTIVIVDGETGAILYAGDAHDEG
jgi:hypothetical protein